MRITFLPRSCPFLSFVLPVLLWKHTATLVSDSFISCFCVFLSPFSLVCPALESPVSHHHSPSCVLTVKFSFSLCQLIFVPKRSTFQQSSDFSSCFLGFCWGFFCLFCWLLPLPHPLDCLPVWTNCHAPRVLLQVNCLFGTQNCPFLTVFVNHLMKQTRNVQTVNSEIQTGRC